MSSVPAILLCNPDRLYGLCFLVSDIILAYALSDLFAHIGLISCLQNLCLSRAFGSSVSAFSIHEEELPTFQTLNLNIVLESCLIPLHYHSVRKVVAKQLMAVLDQHNILDNIQFGFHQLYSTETALPRVSNDLLMHRDAEGFSVLVLLDLSAAFHTLDYRILVEMQRL